MIDITEDGFLSMMAADGTTRADLRLPERDPALSKEIRELFATSDLSITITVLKAMGQEAVVAVKTF